ncbi:hypothetical protein [Streptomyces virginiae]|uniref:hypothetical protein n=1 Tax=Streptomyces virginiae TaxID=1961 RepID=UPI0030E57943
MSSDQIAERMVDQPDDREDLRQPGQDQAPAFARAQLVILARQSGLLIPRNS